MIMFQLEEGKTHEKTIFDIVHNGSSFDSLGISRRGAAI